jgi:hypothetical protein
VAAVRAVLAFAIGSFLLWPFGIGQSLGLIGLFALFGSPTVLRCLAAPKRRVVLSRGTLTSTGGPWSDETIVLRDIRRIDVVERPSGVIESMVVRSVAGRTIDIAGFESVDEIARRLEEARPSTSIRSWKRRSVDVEGWAIQLFLMALVPPLVLLQLRHPDVAFALTLLVLMTCLAPGDADWRAKARASLRL